MLIDVPVLDVSTSELISFLVKVTQTSRLCANWLEQAETRVCCPLETWPNQLDFLLVSIPALTVRQRLLLVVRVPIKTFRPGYFIVQMLIPGLHTSWYLHMCSQAPYNASIVTVEAIFQPLTWLHPSYSSRKKRLLINLRTPAMPLAYLPKQTPVIYLHCETSWGGLIRSRHQIQAYLSTPKE